MHWDRILKVAKECHTKEVWENFFQQNATFIGEHFAEKGATDLFQMLANDPQCLGYSHEIWITLLNAALNTWNLDLGKRLSLFCEKLVSPKVSILSAQIYLESGMPSLARKTAQRALKFTGIGARDVLQLQMIIGSSYVEEGKHGNAQRILRSMEVSLNSQDLDQRHRAEILQSMARANFFLGKYLAGAKLFTQAYEHFLANEDWEGAAKGLFNAAASLHNSGEKNQARAFELLAECKRLSESRSLHGPLAHCFAFYGTDDFQHGNFAGSIEHYRKALEHLPPSDQSFRRLHILSMMSLSYLRMGRYHAATKFGRQTLTLAGLDQSARFKSRYTSLEAELLWQEGQFEQSQALISDAGHHLMQRDIHTLEELSTLTRFLQQSAELDQPIPLQKIHITDSLRGNSIPWLEYLCAHAQVQISTGRYDDAYRTAERCFRKAAALGARYHRTVACLSLIQSLLARAQDTKAVLPWLKEFEIAASRMADTPFMAEVEIIHATLAYRDGDFAKTLHFLQNAARQKRISSHTRLILESWLATAAGASSKLNNPLELAIVARATRVYFRPSIETLGEKGFRISSHYDVDLERHPTLAKLINHLMGKPTFSCSTADLQERVWEQNLSTQGWPQKIRNTIVRIRDLIPYTLAPLLLQSDKQVRLFTEAISVTPMNVAGNDHEEEILKLLAEGPLSSVQLSNRIQVSQATTKRLLKRLTDAERVTVARVGRKVFYHTPLSL